LKHANISFFVPHVGCPRQCSFCDQRAITGGANPPSPEDVERICAEAAKRLGDRVRNTQIAFFGGSFTAIPREYMISLLEPAGKAVKEYSFTGIRCSTRPDAIDRETLELLSRYGVTAVELGAQSMDDRVLEMNRRGHTASQTAEAARLIKSFSMELGLQIMTGLYGDTEETAVQTVESIIALHPDTARIYPTVVLPGTELAELYERGEYRPQTLEEAVSLCAKLLPRLEGAGIRVIRVGLHAERDVEARKLAGPYHPAFRELVQSRVFLNSLLPALKERGAGSYTVGVHPKTISVARGEKRSNVERLENRGFSVEFVQDERVERGRFEIMKGEWPGHDTEIFGTARL